jgi:hypothetical protein
VSARFSLPPCSAGILEGENPKNTRARKFMWLGRAGPMLSPCAMYCRSAARLAAFPWQSATRRGPLASRPSSPGGSIRGGLVKESRDSSLQATLWRRRNLAFPDHHHLPAGFSQGLPGQLVPSRVALQLGGPVVAPRRWNAASGAAVHVPEAAVDVDDLPQSREHQIGSAGKRSDVQAVTVSERMHKTSDRQFGSGVLRLDRRHNAGPLGLRNGVSHFETPFHARQSLNATAGCIVESSCKIWRNFN